MNYPDHETYAALYARYLKRTPEDFLKGVQIGPGTNLLDLCCGGGRLSFYARGTGANVVAVDASERMLPTVRMRQFGIFAVNESVEDFLPRLGRYGLQRNSMNVITCQQAVTYWLDSAEAALILEWLAPGGVFVFNTFNESPSETITVREYEYEGHRFTEMYYLVKRRDGDYVHHVQAREGIRPHMTTFRWISQEEILTMFGSDQCEIESRVEGKTTIWHIRKRLLDEA